jgi:hypothetical protein
MNRAEHAEFVPYCTMPLKLAGIDLNALRFVRTDFDENGPENVRHSRLWKTEIHPLRHLLGHVLQGLWLVVLRSYAAHCKRGTSHAKFFKMTCFIGQFRMGSETWTDPIPIIRGANSATPPNGLWHLATVKAKRPPRIEALQYEQCTEASQINRKQYARLRLIDWSNGICGSRHSAGKAG